MPQCNLPLFYLAFALMVNKNLPYPWTFGPLSYFNCHKPLAFYLVVSHGQGPGSPLLFPEAWSMRFFCWHSLSPLLKVPLQSIFDPRSFPFFSPGVLYFFMGAPGFFDLFPPGAPPSFCESLTSTSFKSGRLRFSLSVLCIKIRCLFWAILLNSSSLIEYCPMR